MSSALRQPMTMAEFLAWEERQELRYEFDGFQAVAMTGGTLMHDRITFRLHKALDARLGTGPCQPFGPNAKVIAASKVRYPDAVVACTPQTSRGTVVESPVVVFEVVSEGSSRTDRIEKVRDYLAASSVQRYVILEQDSAAATVFLRAGDVWQARTLAGDEELAMPEIGISLPIAACYDGLDLPTAA